QWAGDGLVEWWGPQTDMASVLKKSAIVVLPTVYGEGVPKVLLEAAAVGRPIVATNVRGCREAVRDGVNGLLVAPGDLQQLVQAIVRLLNSRADRERFGQ